MSFASKIAAKGMKEVRASAFLEIKSSKSTVGRGVLTDSFLQCAINVSCDNVYKGL